MKRSKSLLCLLLVLLMALSLLPLGAAATAGARETCIINFFWAGPDGEEPLGEEEVEKGKTPDIPTVQLPEGKTLLDWYADKDLKTRFDFSKPLYESTDIYARIVDDSEIVLLRIYLSVDEELPVADGNYAKGDVPTAPADPYQKGKTFLGWYADKEFETRFDFSQPLLKTTSIYARLVADENICWLTYWFGPDDEYPLAGQAVEIGTPPVEVEGPSPEGKTFLGWYADKKFETLFDFTQPMYEDANIYARFDGDEEYCVLNFWIDPDDENPIATQDVEKGKTPEWPADASREGKTFLGWYADKDLKTPFDFTQPLYEDANAYARLVPDEDICGVIFWFAPDDNIPIAGQEVEKGTTPVKPEDPAPEGRTFLGWYVDKELTVLFDFTQPLYEDVNVYAKWAENTGKTSLKGAKVSAAKQTYTGEPLTPKVTVKLNGKTLKKGTDYTVSYKKNTAAGIATVTVTGKGDYIGTAKGTFKILTGKTAIKTIKNVSTGVKLTWKKVTGAKGYEISRKEAGGKWKSLGTVTKASFTDTTAQAGTKYAYRVRCVTKDGATPVSGYSKSKTITFVAPPALKSARNVKSGIKVTWTESAGASKYAVYRKAAGGSWEKLGTTTKTAYTDKTAESGVKYAYKVCCVKKDGTTAMSAYSGTKAVTRTK